MLSGMLRCPLVRALALVALALAAPTATLAQKAATGR